MKPNLYNFREVVGDYLAARFPEGISQSLADDIADNIVLEFEGYGLPIKFEAFVEGGDVKFSMGIPPDKVMAVYNKVMDLKMQVTELGVLHELPRAGRLA